jgi:ubiquinone/menaquinone biosynthesis C-methylase UbiE
MNYLDFHTFLGVDFSPPGGEELVSEFIDKVYFSSKPEGFNYLEAASHTGTLGRKLASLDKHNQIYGIDISSFAIQRANYLCSRDQLKRIEYQVQNLENLNFENDFFDFIDLGIASGFFLENREKCLEECVRVLSHDGVLFTNNLFYVETPPDELAFEVDRILGISIDRSIKYDYDFFHTFYSNYFVLDKELIIEYEGNFTKSDFEAYVREAIVSTDAPISCLPQDVQEVFIKEYSQKRYILRLNEEYCYSLLQAWKLK